MTLDSPAVVQQRLEEIDEQLAFAVMHLEQTALAWFRARRDREVEEARAYASATGPATERKVVAVAAGAQIGVAEEAAWEARKLLVRVLESRANVGMSILKAQGRVGASA